MNYAARFLLSDTIFHTQYFRERELRKRASLHVAGKIFSKRLAEICLEGKSRLLVYVAEGLFNTFLPLKRSYD